MISMSDQSSRAGKTVLVDPREVAGLTTEWTDRSDYGDRIYDVHVFLKSGAEIYLQAKQSQLSTLEKAISK